MGGGGGGNGGSPLSGGMGDEQKLNYAGAPGEKAFCFILVSSGVTRFIYILCVDWIFYFFFMFILEQGTRRLSSRKPLELDGETLMGSAPFNARLACTTHHYWKSVGLSDQLFFFLSFFLLFL